MNIRANIGLVGLAAMIVGFAALAYIAISSGYFLLSMFLLMAAAIWWFALGILLLDISKTLGWMMLLSLFGMFVWSQRLGT